MAYTMPPPPLTVGQKLSYYFANGTRNPGLMLFTVVRVNRLTVTLRDEHGKNGRATKEFVERHMSRC